MKVPAPSASHTLGNLPAGAPIGTNQSTRPGELNAIHAGLADVWQTTWVGSPHTVEVHIAALRGKIGDAGLIQTVRGVGYRLRAD